MAFLYLLLDLLFGCSHRNYTRVFPARKESEPTIKRAGHYVVCTDCGKELPYNWRSMKLVTCAADFPVSKKPIESLEESIRRFESLQQPEPVSNRLMAKVLVARHRAAQPA